MVEFQSLCRNHQKYQHIMILILASHWAYSRKRMLNPQPPVVREVVELDQHCRPKDFPKVPSK